MDVGTDDSEENLRSGRRGDIGMLGSLPMLQILIPEHSVGTSDGMKIPCMDFVMHAVLA